MLVDVVSKVIVVGIALVTALFVAQSIAIEKQYRIKYFAANNTALIEFNSSYWIWFNGLDAFVYGYPTTRTCSDPTKFEPVYKLDFSSGGALKGFECVQVLDQVKQTFSNVPVMYLFLPSSKQYSALDILRLFQSKGIIQING